MVSCYFVWYNIDMTIIRNSKGQFTKGSKFWLDKKRPNISLTQKEKPNLNWLGKNNPNWNGGKRKKHCLLCSKVYFVKPYAINRSKFCSMNCRSKYNYTKAKNPNWKGGISTDRDKLKHSENYKKWRNKVFRRDRWTCKLCGHRSCKSKAHGDKRSDIEAHHIIPIRVNPKKALKVGNGITLCETCHKETYSKEYKFAKVFKEILNDYTLNIPKG